MTADMKELVRMPDIELQRLKELMRPVTKTISGSQIDSALEAELNSKFPPSSDLFCRIERTCHEAMTAGLICNQGGEGRRFGRVFEPSNETDQLSVDVVDLTDIVGPHHKHPTGEICMVMPVTEGARFDGHGAGWCVNPPGSAHHPTVTDGRALVLYLLPEGRIEFTR